MYMSVCVLRCLEVAQVGLLYLTPLGAVGNNKQGLLGGEQVPHTHQRGGAAASVSYYWRVCRRKSRNYALPRKPALPE